VLHFYIRNSARMALCACETKVYSANIRIQSGRGQDTRVEWHRKMTSRLQSVKLTLPSMTISDSQIRHSCTLTINGISLGSPFQQSQIKEHSSPVIPDDSGRLDHFLLTTTATGTVRSRGMFEKGFLSV